mmetsp:Transcript_8008/g.17329  ORF Transcript_8008/g.17329 Transcript_8008/m.17329 type:complete len:167 (+) Transcript_8008:237-737(+)
MRSCRILLRLVAMTNCWVAFTSGAAATAFQVGTIKSLTSSPLVAPRICHRINKNKDVTIAGRTSSSSDFASYSYSYSTTGTSLFGKRGSGKVKKERISKSNLPEKICVVCDRPFTWRKKWERDWDSITCCSKACNAKRRSSPDQYGTTANGLMLSLDDAAALEDGV